MRDAISSAKQQELALISRIKEVDMHCRFGYTEEVFTGRDTTSE